MSPVWPEASARASRCGHSISTGGTAMNSAPGKSSWASPDWPMASSAASVARRSESTGAQKGSTSTESMVPAIVVRRPSVGKRSMRWMPDLPAVRAAQVSSLPWPRDVTTPMPVTATSGRPFVSRSAIAFSSSLGEPDGALAAPMADGGDERLARLALGDQPCGERHARGGLCLDRVTDEIAGGMHGGLRRDVLESRLFLVRDALDAGRAGQHHVGLGSELLRQGMKRCLDAAGLAAGAVGGDACDGRERLCAARGGMLAGFEHQEAGARSEDHAAAIRRALPDRPVGLLPEEAAHLVDQEHVGTLSVVGPADEEDLVLAGGDALAGDADRI